MALLLLLGSGVDGEGQAGECAKDSCDSQVYEKLLIATKPRELALIYILADRPCLVLSFLPVPGRDYKDFGLFGSLDHLSSSVETRCSHLR